MICANSVPLRFCYTLRGKSIKNSFKFSTSPAQRLSSHLTDKAFIDGEWISTEHKFDVINPFDNSIVGRAADCKENVALAAVESASMAFSSWRKVTAREKSKIMRKWYNLVLSEKDKLAELITLENGKPIAQSETEIQYAADFIDWFGEEGRRTYGVTIPSPNPNKKMLTIKQPIGVVSLITPWNFPAAMITRKAVPALMAGCTVVLKPSEETPFSALALTQLAVEAGIPRGVFNIIPCSRSNVATIGKLLASHPSVAGVSFTGSTVTGKLLLQHAASTVKKVSLENGGNAAFLVYDSCDLDHAVQGLMASKFRYSGQTCICANRILVQSNIYDEFISRLTRAVEKEIVVGDVMDLKTTFGPLINSQAVDKVESFVADAVDLGGNIVIGGKRSPVAPNVFQPTVITNVNTSMKCLTSEIFGPIAPILKFDTEDESVRIANQTSYGLASYLFSGDPGQCWRVAESLEFGVVGINESIVSSPECPFGGFKESGLGREGSLYGMDEYMDVKYMCFGV